MMRLVYGRSVWQPFSPLNIISFKDSLPIGKKICIFTFFALSTRPANQTFLGAPLKIESKVPRLKKGLGIPIKLHFVIVIIALLLRINSISINKAVFNQPINTQHEQDNAVHS